MAVRSLQILGVVKLVYSLADGSSCQIVVLLNCLTPEELRHQKLLHTLGLCQLGCCRNRVKFVVVIHCLINVVNVVHQTKVLMIDRWSSKLIWASSRRHMTAS